MKPRKPAPLNWPTAVYMAIFHAVALTAPFCFTWSGLLVAVFLAWLTGCLGITLGYHRLLTHQSFKTHAWVRRMLALLGSLASQGPPVQWVSDHRQHHQYTDQPGDPHTPLEGFWWSHIWWGFERQNADEVRQRWEHYAPDMLKDPFMRALTPLFLPLIIATGLVLYALGGWSWLVWGLFLRIVVTLHLTWCINSVCHWTGYRPYNTADNSGNVWWLSVPSFGESWHCNHHAEPTAANHGHHPAEIDHTYWIIQQMERIGLAWDVRRQTTFLNGPMFQG